MTNISVVVPFYNARDTVARCVHSLLAQTYPRDAYEILLIDNNSTDDSASIVSQYAGVKLFKETKQGAYAARNCGVRAARGEIIGFTDPDCVVAPNWVSAIDASFISPAVNVVLGYRHYGSQTRRMELLAAYEAEKAAFVVDAKIPELYYGFTNNMAVRRALFTQVGFFPERKRGGDTMFVQAVVQQLGCQAIQFARAMEIYHSEVVNVQDYYHKRAIYGQSNERIAQLLKYRALTNRERWRVFQRATQQQKCSLLEMLMLLLLLAPGAIIYERGRRRAMAYQARLAAEQYASTVFDMSEEEPTGLKPPVSVSS